MSVNVLKALHIVFITTSRGPVSTVILLGKETGTESLLIAQGHTAVTWQSLTETQAVQASERKLLTIMLIHTFKLCLI